MLLAGHFPLDGESDPALSPTAEPPDRIAPDAPTRAVLPAPVLAPDPAFEVEPPPPPAAPDLRVTGNNVFGTVNGNARASVRVFRLNNVGENALVLSSITISGRNPRDFTITRGPVEGGQVAPGARSLLQIRFDPVGSGQRRAVLKIQSDDPDTPVYRISIAGHATNPARISVVRIPDHEYLVYQITNTGGRTLSLSASVTEYGAFIYHYQIEQPPPSSLSPGQSGVVKIFRGIAQIKYLGIYSNAAGQSYIRIDLP